MLFDLKHVFLLCFVRHFLVFSWLVMWIFPLTPEYSNRTSDFQVELDRIWGACSNHPTAIFPVSVFGLFSETPRLPQLFLFPETPSFPLPVAGEFCNALMLLFPVPTVSLMLKATVHLALAMGLFTVLARIYHWSHISWQFSLPFTSHPMLNPSNRLISPPNTRAIVHAVSVSKSVSLF